MRLKKEKPKNHPCERPKRKEKQPWHHRKGRRTLPKARVGIGVKKKQPELCRKDCLEGRRRQKSIKQVRVGLRWDNQGCREAGRRQAKLEEEARRQKRPHALAREMQLPAGKLRVAGAWMSFWFRCLHKSWRSPPGAPSGMVGVGKRRCRKVHRKVRWKILPAVNVF